MRIQSGFLLAGIAGIALLAGCTDTKKSDAGAAGDDPAMTGALGDQIMVDPDLAGQNGVAVLADGKAIELPPEQRSPEAIAAAKQEAAKLAGGTLKSAPEPSQGNSASMVENAATAAQIAEASRVQGKDCAQGVEYSMGWASRLPAELAVYPRGAVQEAAGIETSGCSLRVVSFVTPVERDDVLDFYFTRVSKAGFIADHRVDGGDHVLGGSKGGAAYLVYARKLDNGLTEVDLIASGK